MRPTKTPETPYVICPSCGHHHIDNFYTVRETPTNSVLLLEEQAWSLAFPKGDITLGVCHHCGHMFNTAFEAARTEYSGRYESTQGFSPTFNRFHDRLARDLIKRFDLHDKLIVEIGCGHGDFLNLLCEAGDNRGLGYDPAYQPGRVIVKPETEIKFIPDLYTAAAAPQAADFVVCKMTLEHIFKTGSFVKMVRHSVENNPHAVLFFQVPNGRYVLEAQAFWDIYYEHCSYFTAGSLAHLFRANRFDVLDLWTDYNDQYLMIAARPTPHPTTPSFTKESDLAATKAAVELFAAKVPQTIAAWRQFVAAAGQQTRKIALWGGGSKAVAFLTTLALKEEIAFAVDINPNKAHTFLPGTGHEVVPPTYLITHPVDIVIVMNPIYIPEIRADLDQMGVSPQIVGLESSVEDLLISPKVNE